VTDDSLQFLTLINSILLFTISLNISLLVAVYSTFALLTKSVIYVDINIKKIYIYVE
jgi:hypothetical protein